MPSVKPVHVVHCESEPHQAIMDQLSDCRRVKRGNKPGNSGQERSRPLWKVKFPKVQYRPLPREVSRNSKAPTTQQKEQNRTEEAVSHRGNTRGTSADCSTTKGDIFFFSERPSMTSSNEKEKAKQSVLRTISKMLEENHLIRNRLTALNSAN